MRPQSYDVIPVKMGKDAEKKFVDRCIRDVKADLAARAAREEQWKVAVAQYMGRLERDDAGARDSQLDFTQSMELAEQLIARVVNPLQGYRQTYIAKERTPAGRDFAQSVTALCDWITDRTSSLKVWTHTLRSACVYGTGWVRLGWTEETKKVYLWKDQYEVQEDGAEIMVRAEVQEEVPVRVGCFEEILHTPNVIYPDEAGDDPERAPRICLVYREWPEEIERKQAAGVYRKGFKATDLHRSEKKDRGLYLDSVDDDDDSDSDGRTEESYPVTLWEIMRPHPETGEEIILQVEPETGTVLSFVENWFQEDQRGLKCFAFGEVLNSLDGISLMYKLEPMHRAYSAILNMLLDHGTRSIEKLVIVMKRLGLGEWFKNGRLHTGLVEADAMNPEDLQNGIREVKLTEGFSQLQWVMDLLMRHMNNVSNIAAAMFGTEVASRPTASGTEMVLGESKQPLSLMLERFLEFAADCMMCKVGRYRQFFPHGLEWYLESTDPMNAELTAYIMQWPEGYWREQVLVETKVSSQAMSKEVRKQEYMQLVMQLPDVIERIMNIAGAATAANPVSMLAADLASMYLKVVQEYLEEFDIAGAESADPARAQMQLAAGNAYVQQIQSLGQQLQGAQQQIMRMQQQLAPPQPPQPGPPQPGGPGMAGPPGPMGGSPPGPPVPPPGVVG